MNGVGMLQAATLGKQRELEIDYSPIIKIMDKCQLFSNISERAILLAALRASTFQVKLFTC